MGVGSIRRYFAAIGDYYRLRKDDKDLLRAQFNAFVRQIPILYYILVGNAVAVALSAVHIDMPILTRVVPAMLCIVAIFRAQWWRRRSAADFTDEQILAYIRNTSVLATLMAVAFVVWIFLLYPHGNVYERGHFIFFLAITQISCVFCLMPLRSAALSVATIGIVPFVGFFLVADHHRMWVEAINFGLVGLGMVAILNRYNYSFAQLIHSERNLHIRQAETELLSEENRLIAFTDALSGLPNRRALIASLEDLYSQGTLEPDTVAMIFIDLDGFKTVNDDFGHELGDGLIRQVSSELAKETEDRAMLARIGGDEFAILVMSKGASAIARALADKVLARLSLPHLVDAQEIYIGASIGIADTTGESIDPYELLRRADTAMYRVKAGGRGDILFYDPSFDEGRLWRQRIESEIRQGLDRGEFDVVYQPLVDALSENVVAVEALVRWPRRSAGPLPPDEFIGIAEAYGLIHSLGMFVLRRACTELKPHPGLKLSVNVSPAQFRHPRFEQEVAQVLLDTNFPPARLQIEITEGYLIDHPDRANRAIAAFQAMGVSVALDDFGSGFASIGYLRRFGFSAIKIDKSLTADLGTDPKAAMLITGMVHLANGLGMRVTAEGVETCAQATLLKIAGCHELQGFHFGRPSPIAEVPFLARRAVNG